MSTGDESAPDAGKGSSSVASAPAASCSAASEVASEVPSGQASEDQTPVYGPLILNSRIENLKAKQVDLGRERKRLQKDLRNEERKRRRLKEQKPTC